jgi:type I restriction enzyme, R subunit
VLEAPKLIQAKARDMLRHYVDVVMPNAFKAQVVAASRRAAVRYHDALVAARDELVAEVQALDASLLTPEALDALDQQPPRTARLMRAYQNIDTVQNLDFAVVISPAHNDPPELERWTDPARQRAAIAEFKRPLHTRGPGDPVEIQTVAFLIVKSMLLTGFDAPVEQVMYLDRSIKEAELLQAIARVNRTAPNKHAGYVVDYFGVGEHLKVALAAYSSDDIDGALQSINDQVPILRARYDRVRHLFAQRGIEGFTTPEQQEACVRALEDERLRAAYEVALKQFLTSLDVVLPRPEALPYVADAKRLGLIQFRARRRYRETDQFDVDDYGEKVRQLIDDHVMALGVRQKIPPVSITAHDFSAKVAGLSSPRAKASEMEHAVRYHIRKHFDEDPAYFAKLSERLDEILNRLKEQWDQLELALADLVQEAKEGRQVDESGLDPATEAPFFGLFERELRETRALDRLPPELVEPLRQVTVEVVSNVRAEIAVVGFWGNAHAQDQLRGWIVRRLDEWWVEGVGEELFDLDRLGALADQVVELARANRRNLTRS